jgi:hypothetical protein
MPGTMSASPTVDTSPGVVRRLREGAPRPVKNAAAPVKRAVRNATSFARVLPDFLIIGAQKAGTSSLFEYLTAHRDIPRAFSKEVHYFDTNHFRGEGWYRAHFPLRARALAHRRRHGVPLVTCEASPYYLFHPLAGARAREALPEARLVVLLRDPVKRALSHYHHEVAYGRETLPFEEAVEREGERLAGEVDRILADPRYPAFNHQTYSYLSRGEYADQLQAWFEHFGRDRFLIMDAAELYRDPQGTVDRVCDLVGLPHQRVPAGEAWGARRYPALDPELRRRLEEHFAPHNARLFELLGQDFGWPQ